MALWWVLEPWKFLKLIKQWCVSQTDWRGGGEFVKDAVGLSWFMCWIGKLWWRLLTKQVRERFQALMVSHSSASLGSSTLVGTLDLWENKLFSSWWCCWISSRPSERYLRVHRSLHVFCGLWDRGGFWGVFVTTNLATVGVWVLGVFGLRHLNGNDLKRSAQQQPVSGSLVSGSPLCFCWMMWSFWLHRSVASSCNCSYHLHVWAHSSYPEMGRGYTPKSCPRRSLSISGTCLALVGRKRQKQQKCASSLGSLGRTVI